MAADPKRLVWAVPMMLVGALLVYVFVFQSEYVKHEKAEGDVCDDWSAEGRETPAECDEGMFGSFVDILTGDASTEWE